MKIILPDEEKPVSCMAMAKILRVAHLSEAAGDSKEPFCRVGATFLAIDSEDRNRLMKFCETHKESR